MITLHFIYIRSTNMNYFIYTSQNLAFVRYSVETKDTQASANTTLKRLQSDYTNDQGTYVFIRKVMALPFLPADEIRVFR